MAMNDISPSARSAVVTVLTCLGTVPLIFAAQLIVWEIFDDRAINASLWMIFAQACVKAVVYSGIVSWRHSVTEPANASEAVVYGVILGVVFGGAFYLTGMFETDWTA